MEEFEIIAKTFQGLEGILAEELRELGAENVRPGCRMVSYTGDKEMLYRSNLCLRTATRVLKPIKSFRAESADEVYEAVKAMDWQEYLDTETTFAVDSVVYSTEFRHSKFVAYRVKDAIADHFTEKTGSRPNIRITNPDLRLHIHVAEQDCTLSLDSSGDSLHRRGYRQEQGTAPLNEALAAGIILSTGWRGECDFIDPMCGSGTLPIEAALIARNIAPGVYRKSFAFEKWRDFDHNLLEHVYNDDSREREFTHRIYAYDNSRDALLTTVRNVRAAGLSNIITVAQQDIKDFARPKERAIMVMNPPYGERMAQPNLLALYETIGERLKHQFEGNEAWVLSCHRECFDAIGLKASLRLPLFNGPLECELRKYQLFSGKYNEARADGQRIKTDDDRRRTAEARRPRGDWAQGRRPYAHDDRPRDDRPRRWDDRPRRRDDRRWNDRPRQWDDRPRDDRRWNDRPRQWDDRPRDDRRRNDRPRQWDDRPRDDRRRGDDRRMTDRQRRQEERKRYFGSDRDFKTLKPRDDEE